MKDCKYRLPCGRCEKRGAPCDAPKEECCQHDWIYNTEPTDYYNENGELYYITRKYCSKCGVTEITMHTMFI